MDTTSGALSRTLYLLSQHPDVQDRLRQEIIEAKEHNGGEDLSYDTLVSLPYLDAICRETLRVWVCNDYYLIFLVVDTSLGTRPSLRPIECTSSQVSLFALLLITSTGQRMM